MFSFNVSLAIRTMIGELIGIDTVVRLRKYLGIPVEWGILKRRYFVYLKRGFL